MAVSTSIPKGTRDFSPDEMLRRNFIFNTIKESFNLFGYLPIETPAMENLSTLMGKYGEEGDRLIFKILNSGDFFKNIDTDKIADTNIQKIAFGICEKALKYDLTVPFARYVVQHRNEINFPFKRYQIQPVWRADRPQKGRYREFYQCDADVIGTNSLLCEAELLQLIDNVFAKLGINVEIHINNRKILAGIAEYIGNSELITCITVAIDKIDKIGLDKVVEELIANGLSQSAVDKLIPVITLKGTTTGKINELKNILNDSETALKGIKEIENVLDYTKMCEVESPVIFDLTLARGLNYYTGAIIEVKAKDVQIGSICGGGRYDDLTGIFGLPGVSGVGISFGADRIYDVMNELALFGGLKSVNKHIMFVNFGGEEEKYSLKIINVLRKNGISCELYPDNSKIKKQMTYASTAQFPYVAMTGSEEMEGNIVSLKDMNSGEQISMSIGELISKLK